MTDKRIRAVNEEGKPVAGKVLLVYNDAIASGTMDYVQITYISMVDDEGIVHNIRPRNVLEVVNGK